MPKGRTDRSNQTIVLTQQEKIDLKTRAAVEGRLLSDIISDALELYFEKVKDDDRVSA